MIHIVSIKILFIEKSEIKMVSSLTNPKDYKPFKLCYSSTNNSTEITYFIVSGPHSSQRVAGLTVNTQTLSLDKGYQYSSHAMTQHRWPLI